MSIERSIFVPVTVSLTFLTKFSTIIGDISHSMSASSNSVNIFVMSSSLSVLWFTVVVIVFIAELSFSNTAY